MQVKLALLADYANITAEGKLNILGTFDHIAVSEFPAVHPQMQLILRLEAHPAERDRSHLIEIRLHDPDGDTVFEIKGDMLPRGGMPGENLATNQVIGINNLKLGKPGEYTFVIFIDNDMKTELPLTVTRMPAPAQPFAQA
jgi:hypothetical protein